MTAKTRPELQGVLACALGALLVSSLVWHKVSLASTAGFFGLFGVLVLAFKGLTRLLVNAARKDAAPSRARSFKEALVEAGLQKYEQDLSPALANSIFAYTAPPSDSGLMPGASRIGGAPDLPGDMNWPEADGKPLVFLAQFDLADVVAYDKEGLLPSTGFLYFFYDGDVWGFDPDDKEHWRVVFYSGSTSGLIRRSPPPDLSSRDMFRECALRFSARDTLPDERPEEVQIDGDSYSRLLEQLGGFTTHHQLLGHQSPLQGHVKLECQLVSNGLYCGDASGYKDPRAEALRPGIKDWMLLFQVDSDENPNMMWGDLGRLYFCIRRQDLRRRRFDQTWMILQCH